jgi:hypothetical protein
MQTTMDSVAEAGVDLRTCTVFARVVAQAPSNVIRYELEFMALQCAKWTVLLPVAKADEKRAAIEIATQYSAYAGYLTRLLFAYVRKTPAALDELCQRPRVFIAPLAPLQIAAQPRLSMRSNLATLCVFCGFPFECAPFKSLRTSARVLCELDFAAPDDFRAAVSAALIAASKCAEPTARIVWAVWSPTLQRALARGAWQRAALLLLEPADAREATLLLALHCPRSASEFPKRAKLETLMRSASTAAARDAAGLRALDAAGRTYARHRLHLYETGFSKLLNAALRIVREQADAPDFFIEPFMDILTRAGTPMCRPLEVILSEACVPLVHALHQTCEPGNAAVHVHRHLVYRLQLPVRRVRDALKAAGAKWRGRDWIRAPECALHSFHHPLHGGDDDVAVAPALGATRDVCVNSVLIMQPAVLGLLQLEFAPGQALVPVAFIQDELNHSDKDAKHLLLGTTARHVCTFTEPRLFARATVMQRTHITITRVA